jgi:RNA polymerase sigma-70 factor (family 1)
MIPYASLSDAELTDLIKSGDHGAYTEVYACYFGLLYLHARRKVRNTDEARDLVQDTFIALWNRREGLDPEKGCKAYLYAALKNRIIDWYARQEVSSRYITAFAAFRQTGDCITDHRVRESQLAELIEKEVAALPPRMKEVFELSRKAHLSHREIAERLDISEQTVRTQVKHALRILRVRLGVLVYLYLLWHL